MIIIRHRSGAVPLAGKEIKLEGRSGRITFGRDPDACDVVFPPDASLIGRRHFALVRKPSGQWTFDLFGAEYVAMSGEPADADEAVHSGATITLGRHDGPSFDVIVEREAADDKLPVTEVQEEVEGSHAAADHARQAAAGASVAAAGARRFGLVGLVVAVVAIGGAGAVWFSSRSDLNRLMQQFDDSRNQAAAGSFTAPVREKLLQAAYVVLKVTSDGVSSGTASPIGPDTLATNAHVAAMFDEMKPGDRMFVRSPGPNGKEYDIVGATKHPGYTAFQAFLGSDPFIVDNFYLTSGDVGDYDVAILRVAPGSNLTPILELASPSDLAQLAAGFPLAMAGYPAEGVTGAEVQRIGATPTFSIGMVTALTDMFMLPTDAAHDHVIHHNLPATGGSSGSPMVGPNGKVMSFLNSGNLFQVPGVQQRIPNAVLINYAMRSDLLADLVAGRADASLKADQDYWQKQTAAFKRGIDFFVPELLDGMKQDSVSPVPDKATPLLITQTQFQLGTGDRFANKNKSTTQRQKAHPIKLQAGKPQALIVYAQDKQPIELYLVVDGNIVRQDVRGKWFAALPYTSNVDADAQVYVVGPDDNVTYTLFDYGWNVPQS